MRTTWLYHITTEEAWRAAQASDALRPSSLETEGFVHCSASSRQIAAVANRFFQNQGSLLILQLEPGRIKSSIRFEAADGELYPHVYGPINLEAVKDVIPLQAGTGGTFEAPTTLPT